MGNDSLNVRIAPRRAGGDTRRFPPRIDARANLTGLSTAV